MTSRADKPKPRQDSRRKPVAVALYESASNPVRRVIAPPSAGFRGRVLPYADGRYFCEWAFQKADVFWVGRRGAATPPQRVRIEKGIDDDTGSKRGTAGPA